MGCQESEARANGCRIHIFILYPFHPILMQTHLAHTSETMPASYTIRPEASEYAPYYGLYISKVPEGDVIHLLTTQIDETIALLGGLSDKQAAYRYAPGKWNLKEVVGHLCDTERIFAYRALRFSRNDATPIPGFDQDPFTEAANFSDRTLADLLDEFRAIRQATLHQFRGMSETMMTRTGTASGNPFSVRAVAFIIAGHERHHLGLIRKHYLVDS